MVWKLVKLRNIAESLKAYLSLDFLPKFTRNSVEYIGSCMERAVHCQREIVTKRLNRRKKRLLDGCKRKFKQRSSKCTCTALRYTQKKRVIEPDFLANLAYNQRVSKDKEMSMDMGDVETVGEITLGTGETWWKNVIDQSNMPPLYRGPLDNPTRSEYSSATSGFRSGTPDLFSYAFNASRTNTPLSEVADNKSCSDDMTQLSKPREASKSDKILPCCEDKASEVGPHAERSASTKTMVLGFWPKEGRTSSTTKRKRERSRKLSSVRTTSHASDSFSTCVKCSRILSKAI